MQPKGEQNEPCNGIVKRLAFFAATWPSMLGIVSAGVPEQYCWSIFVLVSAAVQNTWGGFNPITWGEALVWTFAMVVVAVLFAVMVGFIVAAIRSSSRANSRYKDQMDAIVVSHHSAVQTYRQVLITWLVHIDLN